MVKDGIINLLKPAGMTSHDGVQFLRRLTGIKRIGHTGTLDPMAVGVLPLCIGGAARINEYLDLDEKQYRCELQLGIVTDTQDIWGTVLEDNQERIKTVTREQITAELSVFKGALLQLPPSYSAVRVDGKRLYEYARAGQTVEVKKRPVVISHIALISYDDRRGRVVFDVTCSKGTYVRTICRDLGQALGTGAAMSFLVRTASGAFLLENTVSIETLLQCKATPEDRLAQEALVNSLLLPSDFPLVHFGKLRLKENRVKWFSNGGYLIDSDVELIKEPFSDEQKRSGLRERINHLGISRRYEDAYTVYFESRFLGVVFYDPVEKRYIADKVFDNESI